MKPALKYTIIFTVLLLGINFFPKIRAQEQYDLAQLDKKIEYLLNKQDETIKKLDTIIKELRKIKIRVSRIRRVR